MTSASSLPISVEYASAEPLPSIWTSQTFRNWMRSICWTLGLISVATTVYWLDKYQGWFEFRHHRLADYRMFKNPTTTPMRIFGIPHFVIAVLFLFTSKRMKQRRNLFIFAALTVVGLGFCWLFKQAGANLSASAVFIFYFYFLIHGFRDDGHFYKTFGEMPKDAAGLHPKVMIILQVLLLGLLFSLLLPATAQFSNKLYHRADPVLGSLFPSSWSFILKVSSMFIPMVAIAIFALWRIVRPLPDGLHGLWRTHRPILAVYILSLGVLVLAMAGGPGAFDIWVLNHFIAWYLFALFLLHRYPPKVEPKGWWPWLRTTPKGFIVLHTGLVLIVAAMMGISVYKYGQKDSPFDWIVGKEAFYYWTIMHVTWSWTPR